MLLRVRFKKSGTMRFASHKDVVRIFQRSFAASGIPVAYSQGYHPHMKLSFGPPLKTGWEGCDEFMDVELDETVDGFASRCNRYLPQGLEVVDVAEVGAGVPKLASDMAAARMAVDVSRSDAATVSEAFEDQVLGAFGGHRDDAPRVLDVAMTTENDQVTIEYTTTMLGGRIVAPNDVAAATVGDPESFRVPLQVTRKAQYVLRDGEYVSPISKGVLRNTL